MFWIENIVYGKENRPFFSRKYFSVFQNLKFQLRQVVAEREEDEGSSTSCQQATVLYNLPS